MSRVYFSSVLNHPVDQAWNLIRDFNSYPRYIEGVTESLIEDGKRGDEIGAVRRFCYGGQWLRQRLTAHSDADRSFTYAGMERFSFPAEASDVPAPAPIDYAGTLRLTPVTDGNRTFVEWFVEFDCAPADVAPWSGLLDALIPMWVGSLDRSLGYADC